MIALEAAASVAAPPSLWKWMPHRARSSSGCHSRSAASGMPGPKMRLITARVSAPGGGKLPVVERV